MPEAPRAATFAFVASRDRLQRLARRVEALGTGCDTRAGALFERLDQLPAAATFEPFADIAAPSADAASPGQGPGSTRRRRPAPTVPAPRAGAATGTLRPAARVTPPSAPLQPASGRAAVSGYGNRSSAASAPLAGPAQSSTPAQDAGSVLAAPTLTPTLAPSIVGPLVSAWWSQWPAAEPAIAAAASAPGARQAGGLAAHSVSQLLLEQLQALAPRAPSTSAAAGRLLPLAEGRLPAAAGLAQDGAPPGARPPAGGPGVAGPASWPLAPEAAADRAGAAAGGAPAPRAISRLLTAAAAGAASGAGPSASPQPAAPAGDAAPAPQDEWLDTMNRLLIDQAWLRGVDLR